MVLFGIGWAAMVGLPYSMVSPYITNQQIKDAFTWR